MHTDEDTTPMTSSSSSSTPATSTAREGIAGTPTGNTPKAIAPQKIVRTLNCNQAESEGCTLNISFAKKDNGPPIMDILLFAIANFRNIPRGIVNLDQMSADIQNNHIQKFDTATDTISLFVPLLEYIRVPQISQIQWCTYNRNSQRFHITMQLLSDFASGAKIAAGILTGLPKNGPAISMMINTIRSELNATTLPADVGIVYLVRQQSRTTTTRNATPTPPRPLGIEIFATTGNGTREEVNTKLIGARNTIISNLGLTIGGVDIGGHITYWDTQLGPTISVDDHLGLLLQPKGAITVQDVPGTISEVEEALTRHYPNLRSVVATHYPRDSNSGMTIELIFDEPIPELDSVENRVADLDHLALFLPHARTGVDGYTTRNRQQRGPQGRPTRQHNSDSSYSSMTSSPAQSVQSITITPEITAFLQQALQAKYTAFDEEFSALTRSRTDEVATLARRINQIQSDTDALRITVELSTAQQQQQQGQLMQQIAERDAQFAFLTQQAIRTNALLETLIAPQKVSDAPAQPTDMEITQAGSSSRKDHDRSTDSPHSPHAKASRVSATPPHSPPLSKQHSLLQDSTPTHGPPTPLTSMQDQEYRACYPLDDIPDDGILQLIAQATPGFNPNRWIMIHEHTGNVPYTPLHRRGALHAPKLPFPQWATLIRGAFSLTAVPMETLRKVAQERGTGFDIRYTDTYPLGLLIPMLQLGLLNRSQVNPQLLNAYLQPDLPEQWWIYPVQRALNVVQHFSETRGLLQQQDNEIIDRCMVTLSSVDTKALTGLSTTTLSDQALAWAASIFFPTMDPDDTDSYPAALCLLITQRAAATATPTLRTELNRILGPDKQALQRFLQAKATQFLHYFLPSDIRLQMQMRQKTKPSAAAVQAK